MQSQNTSTSLRWTRTLFVLAAGSIVLGSVARADENHRLVDAAEQQKWTTVQKYLRDDGLLVHQTQADGMSALHWAATWDKVDIAKDLIECGARCDSANNYGITPLAIACENGSAGMVRLLVKSGADVKQTLPGNQTMLMTVARSGNVDALMAVLEHGAELNAADRSGQTALMWAAANGNVGAIEKLLSRGANPNATTKNGFTAMFFACRQGHWPAAQALLAAGIDINAAIQLEKSYERAPRNGMSGLLFAVESAHYELAIRLVDAGADPNDQRSGMTPLHSISWVRRSKIGDNPEGDPPPSGSGNLTALQFVREIVKRGADVNRRLERGEGGRAQLKPKGSTPFLYAARTADLPLMKTLIEVGADPTLGNADECLPIHAAAGVGVTAVGEEPGTVQEVTEVLIYLQSLGADINSVDKNGETAMHGAAYRVYPEIVAFLAEQKANPTIWNKKNKYGWTPTMIAQGHRPGSFKPSPETIAALQAAMNRP
jgi:uncharacterized protein